MQNSKKEKAKQQVAMVGRREWQINPTTRVKPNKKRPLQGRKAKHKGRQNADLWRFRGSFFVFLPFRNKSDKSLVA